MKNPVIGFAMCGSFCTFQPVFEMDGMWLSISAGELLSLAMSIYYFVKFRNMWRASKPSETEAAEEYLSADDRYARSG